MKYEWKKSEKNLYQLKREPQVIEVPTQAFIMLDGQGNPNQAAFAEQVSALFSLAYAIKTSYKKAAEGQEISDFAVYPLEGLWQQQIQGDLVKDELIYTIMIAQPAFIGEELVEQALEQVKQKKPNVHYQAIRFGRLTEGKTVAMLHLGSFDSEAESFAKMDTFCREQGLRRTGAVHREIYLSNRNRTAPARLKTILRYQVEESQASPSSADTQ